jgi:SCY1-like protein 1
MDFLKSAVASAIAKSSSFPVTIGDRIDIGDSIWTVHNGIKKARRESQYDKDWS